MLAFVCLCMKENGFFRGRYFPKWAHILSRQCFQKKLRQTFKGREAWPKILLQSYKNGMKTFRILIRCIEISNSMLPELDQKLWKGLKNDFESSKNTQIWRKKSYIFFERIVLKFLAITYHCLVEYLVTENCYHALAN